MVCHETYKDNKNNWISPDEIETKNGKKVLKKDNNIEVKIGPSESMSKSKKNTVDPQEIFDHYGADSVRLFILSDSPPEKDVQWSNEGISSSYKFLQKLWTLNLKVNEELNKDHQNDSSSELIKFTNLFIKKMTNNLNNFSYNIIIANLHEMHSFLSKEINKKYKKKTILENYEKILISIMPIIPHFSSECLKILKISGELNWPTYNEKLLEENFVNIVIQINGKKRGLIKGSKDIKEEELMNKINEEKNLFKYLENKNKKKFIPNKLINIIV